MRRSINRTPSSTASPFQHPVSPSWWGLAVRPFRATGRNACFTFEGSTGMPVVGSCQGSGRRRRVHLNSFRAGAEELGGAGEGPGLESGAFGFGVYVGQLLFAGPCERGEAFAQLP